MAGLGIKGLNRKWLFTTENRIIVVAIHVQFTQNERGQKQYLFTKTELINILKF